jgi:hypothetical protein
MYCRRCGTANTEDALKCISCGEPFQAPPKAPPPKIPSYLPQAIVATFCCCPPLGIAAWVFAAQVGSRLKEGDYEGAIKSSQNASLFSWLGLGIGVVFWVAYLILLRLGVLPQG